MAILGNIISRSINLRNGLSKRKAPAIIYQKRTLRKLLEKAQYTQFGKHYQYDAMLTDVHHPLTDLYRRIVPIHDYSKIYQEWWHKCLEGEENVTWPGKIKYFALSSGTSESSSKHIPVSSDMIRMVKKVALKQFYSISNFDVNPAMYTKGVLMLGGTTTLQEEDDYYKGDMSGISAKNIPKVLSNLLYKPGQKIAKTPDWEDRINMIVEQAPHWDVGTLCGVPSWAQIVLERIIQRYNLDTIHDIWPHLEVYIHGGVAFEPYRQYFHTLMGKPITYIETYMASEGSFGFKAYPDASGIKLMLSTGTFYEFVPFDDKHFDDNGNIIGNPPTLLIDEVAEGVNYAIIISTCSGAWRYLIGDTVKFTDVSQQEIIISGRTKQFLSIAGEHTSVDNLNHALEFAIEQMGIRIYDYSVAGYRNHNHFEHFWYVAVDDDTQIDAVAMRNLIDEKLMEINDDYKVERASALKEVQLAILPAHTFEEYMKAEGKYGAMNKFPRVLKNEQLESWWGFLKAHAVVPMKSTASYLYLS